ncbi:MAG: cytochrome c3 family protein [Syntrophobacteraceae bacterium]
MKKGKLVSCLAVTAAIILSATLLAMAAQQPPATITIKPSIWKTFTKPPVTFSHEMHVTKDKIACNTCHMVYKNGVNVWKVGDPVEKCEKCHNEPTTQNEFMLSPDKKKLNLKLSFHTLCIGCHRKIKNQHPTVNAPIVCAGCHKPAAAK